MRLLNVETGNLEQVLNLSRIRYAVLSHTWEDNEPTFQDFMRNPKTVLKTRKIRGLIHLAKTDPRPFTFVWIDTICIDKTSSAELQEAINSMYKWYQTAAACFAYLKDVDMDDEEVEGPAEDGEDEEIAAARKQEKKKEKNADTARIVSGQCSAFEQAILDSRWFRRGWTLQELLAPRHIYFHNVHWKRIGFKFFSDPNNYFHLPPSSQSTRNFIPLIHAATGIPVGVLNGTEKMQAYSVAQRMSWAAKRKTTREEDLAYCLMGLFEVNMPMLYGEGSVAFLRLQDEIMKRTDDHTLFAYQYDRMPKYKASDYQNNLDPLTPADYGGCAHVERLRSFSLYTNPDIQPYGQYGNSNMLRSGGASPTPSTPRQSQTQIQFPQYQNSLLSPALASSSSISSKSSSQTAPVYTPQRWSVGSGSLANIPSMASMASMASSLDVSGGGPVFSSRMEHHVMTNKGLHIELDTLSVPKLPGMIIGRLNCIVKDELGRGRAEDRVVVVPLYQLPNLPGSKVVLRTPGTSLVNLPMWLFDAAIPRPLYITSDAEMHRGSRPLFEFVSRGHPFVVAEMYPPVLSFTHFSGDFRNEEGWPMRFNYAAEDLPQRIYLRLSSEKCHIDFLVKLKLEYDTWIDPKRSDPKRAECSVAAMPPDRSLLELLMLDEYPDPHGTPRTIESFFEYTTSPKDEYSQGMLFQSRTHVHVKVALLKTNCIRLTVTTDTSKAIDLRRGQRDELMVESANVVGDIGTRRSNSDDVVMT